MNVGGDRFAETFGRYVYDTSESESHVHVEACARYTKTEYGVAQCISECVCVYWL